MTMDEFKRLEPAAYARCRRKLAAAELMKSGMPTGEVCRIIADRYSVTYMTAWNTVQAAQVIM